MEPHDFPGASPPTDLVLGGLRLAVVRDFTVGMVTKLHHLNTQIYQYIAISTSARIQMYMHYEKSTTQKGNFVHVIYM